MVRDQIQSFVDQLDVAYAHELERSAGTGGQGLIVIKSWNEWAEGNCLEPGGSWGTSYLDAMRSAAQRWTAPQCRASE